MDDKGLTAALKSLGAMAGEENQSEMFEAEADLPVKPRAKNPKGGRPQGARNKSTEAWREYILARYRSPLVGMLELCNRTPTELAEEMQLYESVPVGNGEYNRVLATGQAARIQVECLKAATPYLHQRQPLAIEAKGEARGLLVIGELNINGSATGDQIPFAKPQENQGVIDVTPDKSDAVQSDGKEKGNENSK